MIHDRRGVIVIVIAVSIVIYQDYHHHPSAETHKHLKPFHAAAEDKKNIYVRVTCDRNDAVIRWRHSVRVLRRHSPN